MSAVDVWLAMDLGWVWFLARCGSVASCGSWLGMDLWLAVDLG